MDVVEGFVNAVLIKEKSIFFKKNPAKTKLEKNPNLNWVAGLLLVVVVVGPVELLLVLVGQVGVGGAKVVTDADVLLENTMVENVSNR